MYYELFSSTDPESHTITIILSIITSIISLLLIIRVIAWITEKYDARLPKEIPTKILFEKPKFEYTEMDVDKYHKMKTISTQLYGMMILIHSFITAIPPALIALFSTLIITWSFVQNWTLLIMLLSLIIVLIVVCFKLSSIYADFQLKKYYLDLTLDQYEKEMKKKITFINPKLF